MKMKRFSTILGIALTVVILISGNVLAIKLWPIYIEDYRNCTHPEYATGDDDNIMASLGVNTTQAEGWIILDFGFASAMPPGTYFTVHSNSTVLETYNLTLIATDGTTKSSTWTLLNDTKDEILQAPSWPSVSWRYVEIHTERGQGSTNHDPAFGSEIDAVTYYI